MATKNFGIIIAVVFATLGAIGLIHYVQNSFDASSRSSTSSDIISGEYDTFLRQKCVERLNSYGLGTVTEGSINLCVDTAKALAYSELNK